MTFNELIEKARPLAKNFGWRDLFSYDNESGQLIHRVRSEWMFVDRRSCSIWNAKNANKVAGTKRPDGYIGLCVFRKTIVAHLVVWEMHHGSIPKGFEIDHINRCKSDNRIENLRLATKSQNAANVSEKRKNNTSGVKGVYWSTRESSWIAEIIVRYKKIRIGTFNCKVDAANAYNAAATHHFGEFAKTNDYGKAY